MTLDQVIAENPGIGRRKLMQKTGCTGYAAEMALNRWRTGRVEHPEGLKVEVITGGLSECEGLKGYTAIPAEAFGIPLRNVRVAEKRPSDSGMRRQLFSLRKSMGYPIDELAGKWGVSEETLRKHAKRLDCLMFVETAPGDWKHCVLHPDTAEDHRKGDA